MNGWSLWLFLHVLLCALFVVMLYCIKWLLLFQVAEEEALDSEDVVHVVVDEEADKFLDDSLLDGLNCHVAGVW